MFWTYPKKIPSAKFFRFRTPFTYCPAPICVRGVRAHSNIHNFVCSWAIYAHNYSFWFDFSSGIHFWSQNGVLSNFKKYWFSAQGQFWPIADTKWLLFYCVVQGVVQVKIPWLHPGGGWVITEKNSTDRFSPLGRNGVVESEFGPAKRGWGWVEKALCRYKFSKQLCTIGRN